MGKKGSRFSVLKKVFSSKKSTPKEEVCRDDKANTSVSLSEHITPSVFLAPTPPDSCPPSPPLHHVECVKLTEEEDEESKHSRSVEQTDDATKAGVKSVPKAFAFEVVQLPAERTDEATEADISVPEDLFAEHTGEATEAADILVPEDLSTEHNGEANEAADISVPEAFALEEVQPKSPQHYPGKSVEEIAAITIQATFRGYSARRTFRALKSLARLKELIDGKSVKRQSIKSLKSMQTLTRMQSRIQASRARMAEENKTLQRQLQIRNDKGLAKSVEEWNDSRQSKEQIEANLLQKQEATLRRQKALTYASTHQRNSFKPMNSVSADSHHPEWGWNWLENWMATRPWISQSMDAIKNHPASTKRLNRRTTFVGEISGFNSPTDLNLKTKPSCPSATTQTSSQPPRHQTPSTTSKLPSSATRKSKPISPTTSECKDSKNTLSSLSKRNRSKSMTSSDIEGLVSSSSVTSFKTPSSSTKVKSGVVTPRDKNVTTHKASTGSTKRQLSFSGSPSEQRRHPVICE